MQLPSCKGGKGLMYQLSGRHTYLITEAFVPIRMERKTATIKHITSRKEKRKKLRNDKKQLHHKKRQRTHDTTIPKAEDVRQKSDKAASKPQVVKSISKSKVHQQHQQTSSEDAEILALEKKLGIGSSADSKKTRANFKRLQSEYAKDGLGEDFATFLQEIDHLSEVVKERKNPETRRRMDSEVLEMNEATRKELEMLQEEDADFLNGIDDLPTDEESDSESELEMISDQESDSELIERTKLMENTARNQRLGQISSVEEPTAQNPIQTDDSEGAETRTELEDEVTLEEDIYGRLVVKSTGGSKGGDAYLAPHLRREKRSTEGLDENRELMRKLNGQLNRISESNLESICMEFEKLYWSHPRSIVNQALLERILAMCCHEHQEMLPLIKVCTALIAGLYHTIGTEIGGFVMETIVLKLHKVVNSQSDPDTTDAQINKVPVNLLLHITMLYNLGVLSSKVIYDLFRHLLERFGVLEIELIFQLLKTCAQHLRSDDHDALKDMVQAVQEKSVAHLAASASPQAAKSDQEEHQRVRYLLDLISELSKTSRRSQKGKVNVELDLGSVRKCLGRIKSRAGSAHPPLCVGLDQLLNADQNGRWWIIGGTFAGHQRSEKAIDSIQVQTDHLWKLAEKHRMNTQVRKQIFVAIMGASDCIDAVERLLRLGLKSKQEREIVRVILHCCGQEKDFNPYYVILGVKLCESDPSFKFSFQLAFWDQFKQFHTTSNAKRRRLFNLASLLAGLLTARIDTGDRRSDQKKIEIGCLSLSCLKVIDFTQLQESHIYFLQTLFFKILTTSSAMYKLDQEGALQVFGRLLQSKKAQATIDGILIFAHQYFDANFLALEEDMVARQKLKESSRFVKQLLDRFSKAAATNAIRLLQYSSVLQVYLFLFTLKMVAHMEPVPLAAKADSIGTRRPAFDAKDPNLMLFITKQPPEIWYKDQCGRKGTFKVHVQRGDHICSFCHSFRSLQAQLMYENGKPVENQNILQAQSGNCLNAEGQSILSLRISQVSKNHQNQRFRVRISLPPCPAIKIGSPSVITSPMLILSKKNKRKESVDLPQMEAKKARPRDRFEETTAANILLPFKSDELDSWDDLSGSNWDIQEPFFKEHAQVDLMWANAAHNFLKRLQFTLPKKECGMKYECLICRDQYSDTPHHDTSCDLGLLLEPLDSNEDSCRPLSASGDTLDAKFPRDDDSRPQASLNAKYEHRIQNPSEVMDDSASRCALAKLSGFSAFSLPSNCPSFSCGLPDHLNSLGGDNTIPSNALLSITPSLSKEISPEITEFMQERPDSKEGLKLDANILCSLSEQQRRKGDKTRHKKLHSHWPLQHM
uniref:Uncharacterized protein AlNc14C112G6432 n=1 Tax=Albugo laibachii Nc14 TaxID=890382 RepID=F0WIN9_9STRA|nr:conserved hypothetical protein [Albugo laibachii Nc14]|eukprot:CCA21130.1 conserved hypothetical protein [Albugo laibachii Nc14]